VSRHSRSVSRRRFLASAAAVPVALALPRTVFARGTGPAFGVTPALPALPRATVALGEPRHLAWVWQFRHDGEREAIRNVLASHGLGIALKVHDGTDWMSKYDKDDGIDGPAAISAMARYFEDGGVPFHAWGVLHGTDPVAEATIGAQVIGAGARSLIVDLEAHAGFWRGTNDDASRYGEELRRREPNAVITTSVDARPWEVPRIPLAEFAEFSNAIAPQVYWGAFNNSGNIAKYRKAGDDPGEDGVTARFALQSAIRAVGGFGLPVNPIGDGTVAGGTEWNDFIDESFASNAQEISVWRYGVTDEAVWQLLRDRPPRTLTYSVQSGDTLSALAAQWGTSVDAIVQANSLTNANFLSIGQQLRIPGGSGGGALPAPVSTPVATNLSGKRYTVRPGDSLWSIAIAFDTTVEQLAKTNSISNHGFIRIGDTLIIP